MRRIVIGTAGHVDHGKTELVRVLTGQDTDRLPEEKARGITIENGFADMELGSCSVSIIDVPGHERFIRNMLAGIGGIDLVLFVVALDEGIMPQTREHLQILQTLGIEKGILVFTKEDLVPDEEWKALVEEEAEALVRGTFLENGPRLRVSARTGEHIDLLKNLLSEELKGIAQRENLPENFRMPVDRVFTAAGFGTVATGTLLEGSISAGEEIWIYPEKKKARIRNIQVHGKDAERAFAGERTAVNLPGIKREEIRRGNVLAGEGRLQPSTMLDVEVHCFSDSKRDILNGSRVHFYCGAEELIGKVVLLDKDKLEPGQQGFAQIRFERDLAVKRGDHFILRFLSPVTSIGGGRVLDPFPCKHKRGKAEVIEQLHLRAFGSDKEILCQDVRASGFSGEDEETLNCRLGLDRDIQETALRELGAEGILIHLDSGNYIHASSFSEAMECGREILEPYHRQNPLSQGMKREEFKSRLAGELKLTERKAADTILREGILRGKIKAEGDRISLPAFTPVYSEEAEAMRHRLYQSYREAGLSLVKTEKVLQSAGEEKLAGQVMEAMLDAGELRKISPAYNLDRESYLAAKAIIERCVCETGSITVAQFRDEGKTSRKSALILLEHFDEAGFTRKEGDYRVLFSPTAERLQKIR